jgi:hypothetical protein
MPPKSHKMRSKPEVRLSLKNDSGRDGVTLEHNSISVENLISKNGGPVKIFV